MDSSVQREDCGLLDQRQDPVSSPRSDRAEQGWTFVVDAEGHSDVAVMIWLA